MKSSGRKISFLVDKCELELLEEACDYGADADKNIDAVTPEKGQYRISFSYEELDDLAGFVAGCANHETSKRKRNQFDELYDKIDTLLKLSESLKNKALHVQTGQIESIEPSKPKKPALKYFVFDVWLERKNKERILRKIQIAETKSLYNFAKAIVVDAFDFYFDHAFGFYERLEGHFFAGKAYELFVDIGEEPTMSGAQGTKKKKVSQAFKTPGERMILLFDYGDSWHFFVELKEIKPAEKWDLKPVILESIGKSPEQYPILEHEED